MELDMKTYTIPGLDKPNTNAILNCGNIICERISPFFKAEGETKKFVYQEEVNGETFKVVVEKVK